MRQGLVPLVKPAGEIKVPVFLAVRCEEKCTLIKYIKRMGTALKKAGAPEESLHYSIEGHGFYYPEQRR